MSGDLIERNEAILNHCILECHKAPDGCEVDCAHYHLFNNIPAVDKTWIPICSRPMTTEERQKTEDDWGYTLTDDEAVIYLDPLPGDGDEVLTCNRYGEVKIDRFVNDPDNGCYFEDIGDTDGIIAWMQLPKPYVRDK